MSKYKNAGYSKSEIQTFKNAEQFKKYWVMFHNQLADELNPVIKRLNALIDTLTADENAVSNEIKTVVCMLEKIKITSII